MRQPRSIILIIQGATDHSCLKKIAVEQNTKTFTSYSCNFLKPNKIIIFQLDGFQP